MEPDTEKWFKEHFVIWPPYKKGKATLTETERWFFEGVRRGTSYAMGDPKEFKERYDMYDSWDRAYQRELSKIKEPRWVPEKTTKSIRPKLP